MAGEEGQVQASEGAPSVEGPPRSSIVVGVDGSPGATRALDWAGAEAERADARLTIVAACLYGGLGVRSLFDDAQRIVKEAAERATEQHPDVDIEQEVPWEPAAEALIDASQEAELLVVGSRGLGGFRSLLLGSVGQHCLTYASCSVAIVRTPKGRRLDDSRTRMQRIVVGVDGSDESNRALDWAVDEARRTSAELDIVGSSIYPGTSSYVFAAAVGAADEAKQVVSDAVEHVDQVAPEVVARGATSEDPPPVVLVDASRNADLVVVGSRGLGAFRGLLLGSVSHYVATHASCSVVVVRASAG